MLSNRINFSILDVHVQYILEDSNYISENVFKRNKDTSIYINSCKIAGCFKPTN